MLSIKIQRSSRKLIYYNGCYKQLFNRDLLQYLSPILPNYNRYYYYLCYTRINAESYDHQFLFGCNKLLK